MQEYDNIFKNFKNYYLFYIAKHENPSFFLKEVFLHPKLIHQKNSRGETLSHLLCYEGMIEKYSPYIEMGGENSHTEQLNNVLHYCVSSGADTFLMIDLINKGINPLDKNQFGQTPMHMLNSLQATSYFANWNFRTFSKMERLTDNEGNTIAHSAAINKNTDILNFLLKEYPNLKNIKNNLGLTPEQILFLSKNPFFNSRYKSKEFYNLFSLYTDKDEVIFQLILSDTKRYFIKITQKDIFINYKLNNSLSDSELINVELSKFVITRERLTNIDKLKPLSLQMLKYEAKDIFKDSEIYQNEFTEIYKDTIEQRSKEDIPEHNFNFDISKKFL